MASGLGGLPCEPSGVSGRIGIGPQLGGDLECLAGGLPGQVLLASQRRRGGIDGCRVGRFWTGWGYFCFLAQFPAEVSLGSGQFASPQSEGSEPGQLGLPRGFEHLGASVEQSVEFPSEVVVLFGEVLFPSVEFLLPLLLLDLGLAGVSVAGQRREGIDIVSKPTGASGETVEFQQISFERGQQVEIHEQLIEGGDDLGEIVIGLAEPGRLVGQCGFECRFQSCGGGR